MMLEHDILSDAPSCHTQTTAASLSPKGPRGCMRSMEGRVFDPTLWKASFQILNVVAWAAALTLLPFHDAVLVINMCWFGAATFFFAINPTASIGWLAPRCHEKERMYAKTKGAMGFLGVSHPTYDWYMLV